MNTQLSNLIIIDSTAILYMVSTLLYRHYYKTDAKWMQKNVVYKCDTWCIKHIIQYICLGYFSPNYWITILLISILFEYIEFILSKKSINISSRLDTDPIINSFGLLVGVLLQKAYPANISLLNILKKSVSF